MQINLDYYLYINLLNIQIVEKIFIKYGGLEKGSFAIYQKVYSDGSSNMFF